MSTKYDKTTYLQHYAFAVNEEKREELNDYYRKYRERNREEQREYMREYMRKYRKTKKGKQASVKAEETSKLRKKLGIDKVPYQKRGAESVMASKAKDKGRRLENAVVKFLRDIGIVSERVPLSGSLGGKYDADVIIGSVDRPLKKIECKNRENISSFLWTWLEGNNYLVVKRNKKEPLIVMTMSEFAQLAKHSNFQTTEPSPTPPQFNQTEEE